mmetsp:Transcript_54376/g.161957  ORF Transcript_54376/g.161957 Transcript_54376/m.161957 type:complete len:260 (-) Transcript_54376:210-989(-)
MERHEGVVHGLDDERHAHEAQRREVAREVRGARDCVIVFWPAVGFPRRTVGKPALLEEEAAVEHGDGELEDEHLPDEELELAPAGAALPLQQLQQRRAAVLPRLDHGRLGDTCAGLVLTALAGRGPMAILVPCCSVGGLLHPGPQPLEVLALEPLVLDLADGLLLLLLNREHHGVGRVAVQRDVESQPAKVVRQDLCRALEADLALVHHDQLVELDKQLGTGLVQSHEDWHAGLGQVLERAHELCRIVGVEAAERLVKE